MWITAFCQQQSLPLRLILRLHSFLYFSLLHRVSIISIMAFCRSSFSAESRHISFVFSFLLRTLSISLSAAFRLRPILSASARKSLLLRFDFLAIKGQCRLFLVLRHHEVHRQQVVGRGQYICPATRFCLYKGEVLEVHIRVPGHKADHKPEVEFGNIEA